MRRLTRGTIREAQNILTLTRARTSGSGGGVGAAAPQPTAQNEILIANATPAWSLLTAPAAEGQALITGADPYMPAWGTTFPTVIQFDAGITFGGGTGVNTLTIPDSTTEAISIADSSGIEYLRIGTTYQNVTINEDNEDIDFVVEAVGQNLALIVQGSDGYVGIATDPDAPFHVHYLAQFDAGITLAGATTGNVITVPDNLAEAMNLVDAGGIEYLRIVSTDAQPAVVFNDGGVDVDFRIETSGEANAVFIRGSDGLTGFGTDTLTARVTARHTTAKGIYGESESAIGVHGHSDSNTAVHGNSDSYMGVAAVCATGTALYANLTGVGTDIVRFEDAGTAVFKVKDGGDTCVYENSAWVRLSGTFAWTFIWPEPTVDTVGQIRIPWACTVTRVDGNVIGGTSCTLNIEERGTLGSAGTNVLSSDMVADANGESVTGGFNNSSLASGNYLAYDISAVSGAVDYVSLTITGTID